MVVRGERLILLFKHFWVAFVIVTILNGAIWWFRGRPHRERDPSLTEGYRSLVKGLVVWGNLPWLIMGSGILFGGVPTMFHYFNPRDPNPFVKAWFVSVVAIWIAGTYWLFVHGGAEQLIRHPGLIQSPNANPIYLKVIWLLSIAGGIAAFVVMYLGSFAPPRF